jgi:adenylate kinase
MQRLKILVIGPPSCGKTTISKALADHYECKYVSSGDYARSIKTKQNDAALAVGDLSPDHLAIAEWVAKQIYDYDRIVMDGFPRSSEQHDAFDFETVDLAIWLDTPVGLCLQRAGSRGRTDDQAPVFWRRYMNYMKHTGPLMWNFSQTTKVSFLHFLDQGLPVDENVQSVQTYIDKLLEDRHNGRSSQN